MLTKLAGALLAATLLTAPAFAEDMSKTPAPAAVATQPAKADAKSSVKTDVKADAKATTVKAATVKTTKGKHARKHFRSHLAKHSKGKVAKVTSLKHVKHIKTSKRIHAKGGTVAATKSVTKTGTN